MVFGRLSILALAAAADSESPAISLDLGQYKYKGSNYKLHRNRYPGGRFPKGYKQSLPENRFADECDVGSKMFAKKMNSHIRPYSYGADQNVIAFDQLAVKHNCKEPKALAYDHHDGDLSSSIKTSYTLFVESRKLSNPVDVNKRVKGIEKNLRGEWVIQYDVKDANGNKAEQVQFALIIVDEQKPNFMNSPAAFFKSGKRLYNQAPSAGYNRNAYNSRMNTHCTNDANCKENYRTYFTTQHKFAGGLEKHTNVVLELCGNLGKAGYSKGDVPSDLYWYSNTLGNSQIEIGKAVTKTKYGVGASRLEAYDAYDGILDQLNSKSDVTLSPKLDVMKYNGIDDFFYDATSINAPNPAEYKDMTSPIPMWKTDGRKVKHLAQSCMARIATISSMYNLKERAQNLIDDARQFPVFDMYDTRGRRLMNYARGGKPFYKRRKIDCAIQSLMTRAQKEIHPSRFTKSMTFIALRTQCLDCADAYADWLAEQQSAGKLNCAAPRGATQTTDCECQRAIDRKKYENWYCGRPLYSLHQNIDKTDRPLLPYINGRGSGSYHRSTFSKADNDYTISATDFADIFGKNNKNNVRVETGNIFFQDSIIPTIQLPMKCIASWTTTGTHSFTHPITRVITVVKHNAGESCRTDIYSKQGCACSLKEMCLDYNNDMCSLQCTAHGAACWLKAKKTCAVGGKMFMSYMRRSTGGDLKAQCIAEGHTTGRMLSNCMIQMNCMNTVAKSCTTGDGDHPAHCSSAVTNFECGYKINSKEGQQVGTGMVSYKSRDPATGEWVDSYRPSVKYYDCYDTHTKNENWVKIVDTMNPHFDFDETSANWAGVDCSETKDYQNPTKYRNAYAEVFNFVKNKVSIPNAAIKKMFVKMRPRGTPLAQAEAVATMYANEVTKIFPQPSKSVANKYNKLWSMKQADCVNRCERDVATTQQKHTTSCKTFCASVNKYHAATCFSKPQTVTISYDVVDNFGNHADQKYSNIGIVDTIAPTLYLTKHDYVEAEGSQYNMDPNSPEYRDFEKCDGITDEKLHSVTKNFKTDHCEGVRFCLIRGKVHVGKSCKGKQMHGRYELQKIDWKNQHRNVYTGKSYDFLPANTGCSQFCANNSPFCKPTEQKTWDMVFPRTRRGAGSQKNYRTLWSNAQFPGTPSPVCASAYKLARNGLFYATGSKYPISEKNVAKIPEQCYRYICVQQDEKCVPACTGYAGQYSKKTWQKNPSTDGGELQKTPWVEHSNIYIKNGQVIASKASDWENVAGKAGEEQWLKSSQEFVHVHNTVLDYNQFEDQLLIQHSAGYAGDYRFVEELLKEGTGYECFDLCSDTTTVVQWQKSCSGNTPGARFEMKIPGTYYLKYDCHDQAGEEGLAARHTTACRTFINVDRTRPILEVYEQVNNKDGTFHVEASRDNNYIDAGAACSDVVDGILTQDVQVSGDVVNMATVGTYLINYDCEDDAGRQAYQAHRTVIVEDTTCPTCSIPGGSDTITIEASFPYSEAQSVCTDNIDGYLGNARKTGSIDVELTGTYILTYSSTDRMNNGRGDKMKGLCKGKTYTSRGWVVNQPEHTTKTVIVEDTMVPIISLSYKKGKLMAESNTNTNAWVIGAIASAISGVALLGYAATRNAAVSTTVPV
jgi:hypothetical protein